MLAEDAEAKYGDNRKWLGNLDSPKKPVECCRMGPNSKVCYPGATDHLGLPNGCLWIFCQVLKGPDSLLADVWCILD